MSDDDYKSMSNEQEYIYDNIIERITTYDKGIYSITGQAGVGKTYLTSKIIEFLYKSEIKNIITSTTHKALDVLSRMIKDDYISMTIHSFLGIKLCRDYKTGKYTLKQEYHKYYDCNVLIIDESSMISSDVWNYIYKYYKNKYKIHIILIGDKYQLPPIEDDNNKYSIFDLNEIDKIYTLKKIIRQSENNPIIKFSTDLRSSIENNKCSIENLKTILRRYKNEKTINICTNKDLKEYIKNNDFKYGEEIFCSYLNSYVNIYGKEIHKRLCGDKFIYVNDIVIIQKPYIVDDKVIIQNSNDMEILKCEIKNIKLKKSNYDIKVWECNVYVTKTGDIIYGVYIIDSDSINIYKKHLQYLWKKKDKYEYFLACERYIEVKHFYTSTIHKLQGSSIDDHVIIDMKTLLNNNLKNITYEDRYRLLYVAITRTRNKVSLCI